MNLRYTSPPRRSSLGHGLLIAFALGAPVACSKDATGPATAVEPSLHFIKLAWPVDLTPDGSIAAIQDPLSAAGDLYFYHTATDALEYKTRVGDPFRDFATGISADGAVSALHGDPVQAGLWTAAGEWTDLAPAYRAGCDQDLAASWDVSADGHILVGLVWNGCHAEAFRWNATGTGIMTPLQRLGEPYPGDSNPPANRATVVSDDGRVAAGWAQISSADRWPAIWQADGSGTLLSGLSTDAPGEVLSITPDGNMVAGSWGMHAFTWTAAQGMVDIGQPAGADSSLDPTFPNAIAANGKLIFGGSGSPWFSIPRAFVWTAGGGMRPLADVVSAAGVTIPSDYLLTNVIAASNDGSVVLGTAYDPKGATVTFVLRLPISAYGL